MDKYQMIGVVGEGSYGVVVKCRHRESGQLVAIKRFLETEEDHRMRRMVFREIRLLKKLHHENLVNMIQVFRRKKRFYLVFEYLDHTLLDELENIGGRGLGLETSKRHIFQILRGLSFCHANNIMHRDIKPENILVSPNGVVKLCDFGFARLVNGSIESCTDYVATRWYRAPELLVGDPRYGKPVDVWAVGCVYAEMVTGDPLFPGESDVDQLYRITKLLGGLCQKHQSVINGRNRHIRLLRHTCPDELIGPPKAGLQAIRKLFPEWNLTTSDFLAQCLHMDPSVRPKCSTLLQHPFFTRNSFAETFLEELRERVAKEIAMNPLTKEKSTLAHFPEPQESLIRVSHAIVPSRWRITVLKDNSIRKYRDLQSVELPKATRLSTSHRDHSRRSVYSFDPVSVPPNTIYLRAVKHAQGTRLC